MRVCMPVYSFYENDNRVRRYAETLAARGDAVEVIALRRPHQSSEDVVRGDRVFRIQSRERNERGRLSYISRLLLFFFRSAVFLSWRHLRNPYQLIHVHSVPDFEVFAALFPKLTGCKVILDIHDLVPEFYASKFQVSEHSLLIRALLITERMSARFADHVIIANHIWRETLISRSVTDVRCTVVLNWPDPTIFARRGRIRTDNRLVMLYPGTLNHHQGIDIAIRAFASIKDVVPQVDFHIYGEGGDKANLAKLIEELALQDRIVMRDPVPLIEVPSLIENADLGIVPKRKDCFANEAFSTKILEFMIMGVPVIVSDTKIDRYYFDESVLKFFRGHDEKHLAECMLELIKDPEARVRLSSNALKFVADKGWDVKKAEYLDLVDRLASNASGREVVPGQNLP
jgi:glycosyltransferase involved in cell wall biosynthesis